MTALYEEALAVRTLAAELEGEDLELSIESETGFVEAVEKVLSAIHEAEFSADVLAVRIENFRARQESFRRRAERLRDVLIGAMVTADRKSLRLPEATLTVSEPAPTAVVTDEAALPANFLRLVPAKGVPDMRLITETLRRGVSLPGATLKNGAPRLTVRTK